MRGRPAGRVAGSRQRRTTGCPPRSGGRAISWFREEATARAASAGARPGSATLSRQLDQLVNDLEGRRVRASHAGRSHEAPRNRERWHAVDAIGFGKLRAPARGCFIILDPAVGHVGEADEAGLGLGARHGWTQCPPVASNNAPGLMQQPSGRAASSPNGCPSAWAQTFERLESSRGFKPPTAGSRIMQPQHANPLERRPRADVGLQKQTNLSSRLQRCRYGLRP